MSTRKIENSKKSSQKGLRGSIDVISKRLLDVDMKGMKYSMDDISNKLWSLDLDLINGFFLKYSLNLHQWNMVWKIGASTLITFKLEIKNERHEQRIE
jgi:hypothetical protein